VRNTSTENAQFAKRLADAMKLKSIKHSPTALQRAFNDRFEGRPVTPHTARNWMLGKVLPTQDKLICLAELLDASSEYLRYGTNNGRTFVIKNKDGTENELTDQQQRFVRRYLQLNNVQQSLVSELVTELASK
jgi:hypothetical protein